MSREHTEQQIDPKLRAALETKFTKTFKKMPTSLADTRIMAILNLTPDSFSDGGRLSNIQQALRAAEHALIAGSDILDIGGESTRPGASPVSETEELKRVIPVIEAIHQEFPQADISIDTRKAKVAELALDAGATMINDISGLQFSEFHADPTFQSHPECELQMAEVAAKADCTLIIMHSQGLPDAMQKNPSYPDGVLPTLLAFFERQIKSACRAGVSPNRIILDPGLGFGKTLSHNITLFHHLDAFHQLGYPLLLGASRKSFLTLGNRDIAVDEREALTAAAIAMALERGVQYLRIHDVETHIPVIRLCKAILTGKTDYPATPARETPVLATV